uniref:CCHC-type domain-containing protein n=1 Tax=Tanacetum cinerariifolium TaxID=118510 RepID=A0A6L2MB67_TANCI|nr:hypothetical protein [Tanacetum cinerariifolium]
MGGKKDGCTITCLSLVLFEKHSEIHLTEFRVVREIMFSKIIYLGYSTTLLPNLDPIIELLDMSTSSTHQQSLTDADSETRPMMLEKVDSDDDYQGDTFQNNSEDPLISTMMLLARATAQCFSNPTNNRLRTSSNTRFQVIMQGDKVNIHSQNSGNDGRNTRRSFVSKEIIEGNNVRNEVRNIQRTLRTTSTGSAANVQCYNCNAKGHYAHNYPKPKVRDSKYLMEQMLLAKQDEARVTLTDKQNDVLVADATRIEGIKELSANI